MWIIIGNRVSSERVPNGKVAQHHCNSCGETAMFYERHIVKTMRLYFIDVFNYKRQRAMACGACGALYATDEFGASADDEADGKSLQAGTIAGHLESAAKTVGDAFREGANELLGRGREAARASREEQPRAREERAREPDLSSVDLRTERERELDRRFEELERKAREKKGEG